MQDAAAQDCYFGGLDERTFGCTFGEAEAG